MRTLIAVFCLAAAVGSRLAAEITEKDLTPLALTGGAIVNLIPSVISNVDIEDFGLYRDDICLRVCELPGKNSMSFKMFVKKNQPITIISRDVELKADMDILVYNASGNLVISDQKSEKHAIVMFFSPYDSVFEIVLIRSDVRIDTAQCMTLVFSTPGYRTTDKKILGIFPTFLYSNIMHEHSKNKYDILNVKKEDIQPVKMDGKWLAYGFVLGPSKNMHIKNLSSSATLCTALASYDEPEADIDATLFSSSDEVIKQDTDSKHQYAMVTWAPESNRLYKLTLKNAGSRSALVVFSQFDFAATPSVLHAKPSDDETPTPKQLN